MNKRIGILTQPLHYNYGGILQAYSLQKKLQEEGYDVLVIDRDYSQVPLWRKSASRIKHSILNIKKYITGETLIHPFWITEKQFKEISKNTNSFINTYIPKTDKVTTTKGLKKISLKYNFDCYIVGSDQVWRPIYSPEISNYYLDFLVDRSVRKIAYAASFGVDEWEYTRKQTNKILKYVPLFDAISVREDSAVSLCKQYLKVESKQVLDPTMLLKKEDFIQLVLESEQTEFSSGLFYYILDTSLEKDRIVTYIANVLDMDTFTVMPEKRLSAKTVKDINQCVFPCVTKWLRAFMDAEYVVTDSFHGCVFSIIFNKPFIVVGNPERGLTRINSLLKLFDLEKRLIINLDDLKEELICESFEWIRINEIRSKLGIESFDFLKKNI